MNSPLPARLASASAASKSVCQGTTPWSSQSGWVVMAALAVGRLCYSGSRARGPRQVRRTPMPTLADVPPGRYRHLKGGLDEVLGVARHSGTEEALVVYRPLYVEGGLWARPLAMFRETVTVDGRQVPRFTPLASAGDTAT